jgi:serine/threonine protein kinase
MVTFCEPGVHVDEDLPTLKNHVRLHRSLTQTLGWLAEHGIHYRDLNNGNVLRNATGECVLIDFGNARYLRRPRGQTNQDGSEEVHISFDDARSGTLMFMSRRIHELTNLDIAYKKLQAQYEANLRQLHTIDDLQYRAVKQRQCTSQQKQLVKKQNQMSKIYHEHRYADDAESQFFLGMQQVSGRSHSRSFLAADVIEIELPDPLSFRWNESIRGAGGFGCKTGLLGRSPSKSIWRRSG